MRTGTKGQVGSCSVELTTVPVKPSLLETVLGVVAITFVASLLLAGFLPDLTRFSMWLLS